MARHHEEREHERHHEEHERRAHGGHARHEREEEREHEHRAGGGTVENQSIDGDHPDHAKGGHAHGGHHMTHGGHRHAHGGAVLHNRGPHPGHGHPEHKHHASGGFAKGGRADDDSEGEAEEHRDAKAQVYNAQGSQAMKSATDEEPGFSHGGKAKKKKKHEMKEGGHAHGEMAHHRLDRRPRRAAGGSVHGHTPYSSAARLAVPESTVAGSGFEGPGKDLRGTK